MSPQGALRSAPDPIFIPPRAGNTPMDVYRRHINHKFNQSLHDTPSLHQWTIKHPHNFWIDLYGYMNLIPSLPATMKEAYDSSRPMSSIPPFFEGHKINYAENVLAAGRDRPNVVALIGVREYDDLAKDNVEVVTWAQLSDKVRVAAHALAAEGVQEGDRVAALVSNSVLAVVLNLATAAIGAIFTSINPDLGVEGCVARLLQVTPSLLFADTDATYKGRTASVVDKVDAIMERLQVKPKVFLHTVSVPSSKYPSASELFAKHTRCGPLSFNRVSFNHPLVICYSSGTTGPPKCIVHRHGLILMLRRTTCLHNSMSAKDVVLQYSTTTWVMFQIMLGHLAAGATCICYDGSPMWPDVRHMLRLCEKFRVTYFGSSPRYLLELSQERVKPASEFDLSSLRMVQTTGAPLAVSQYHWIYDSFPPNVHLANTAGGTDTATTLLGVDPAGPLHPGEMQTMTLGIDVDILDPNTGASVMASGEAGELVIRQPFPSMPCFFWGDEGNKIYRSSYFSRFDNVDVWAQHDWLKRNPGTGGFIMPGRSDGVLNPSGIRFGSGEIYAVVEGPAFNDDIAETLCVGRRREQDNDEIVFLFLRLLPGRTFSQQLEAKIRQQIRQALSARHVPKYILPVEEIPVTINGKKIEIAVKQLLSGQDIKISSTVANPKVLMEYSRYKDWPDRSPKAKL